jgi:lipopolysaccharide transport system ATP-binding protein
VSAAPLIEAVGLCKRYPMVARSGDRLRALCDVVRGRPVQRSSTVLEDVGFVVRPGESLAIIGENGAGKSTLLKLVTGVLTPSAGSVSTRGRIGALLELGAGFHPEYSGRDNVRMAAALHGLSGRALEAKLPEIEAFADIGAYLDEPVKHYSSGMIVRLGFAVIAAVRPGLLITDEVLAVGDESFQKKCIRWLDGYLADGGTLLLVSHSMYHVQKLCRRTLWLHQGRTEAFGETFEVTQRYLAWHAARDAVESTGAAAPRAAVAAGDSPAVLSLSLGGDDGPGECVQQFGADLVVEAVLRGHGDEAPTLLVGLVREDGTPVYGVSSEMDGVDAEAMPTEADAPRRWRYRLEFPALPLLPGAYSLRAHALDAAGLALFDTLERRLTVRGERREFGLVHLAHDWSGAETSSGYHRGQ